MDKSAPAVVHPATDRRTLEWYVDKAMQVIVFGGGISAIIFIIGIFVFISKEGFGFLVGDFNFKEFFFSPNWRPTSENNQTFGILALELAQVFDLRVSFQNCQPRFDELQAEAQSNIDGHDREVADGIDAERTEVSEPVRDAEDIDRQASADLYSAASSAGDYSGNIEDAGGIRDHAADFLQDIAEFVPEIVVFFLFLVSQATQQVQAAPNHCRADFSDQFIFLQQFAGYIQGKVR